MTQAPPPRSSEPPVTPLSADGPRPGGPVPRGRTRRRLTVGVLVAAAAAGAAAGVGILAGFVPDPITGSHAAGSSVEHPREAVEPRLTTVKVVKPKRNAGSEVFVERIATVEPYYRADLRARASGLVKVVHYDIGETVKQGDVLIEIDVAESEQDVAQKAAVVVQREHELSVSRAKQKDAMAARDVTAATIRQRQAEVQAITATRDLKKRKVDRYRDLSTRGSVTGNVVEEEERDLLASEAALLAAGAGVERAMADHAESASKVEAAAADVELKKAQIEVAKKDLARARVVADYGRVIAPFDGVVVRRNVDPGSFVQNATSGASETLISISRIDLLTVVAQFPDTAAPFIQKGTPAVVQIPDLPGLTISTDVARVSPTIQNSDRTMRVEIDLFNGNSEGFSELERSLKSSGSQRMFKVSIDDLATPAFGDDATDVQKLIPGMNGSVKLAIGGGKDAIVVPSSAVYSRSGTKYILIVEGETTRQVPVQVHLNDGRVIRLSIVTRSAESDGRELEHLRELTGEELIVVSNQLQVGDGAKVRCALTEW